MKVVWIAMILYLFPLFSGYSIVFVHIGDIVPPYTDSALSQARLFNPDAKIILLSSKKGLKRFRSLKNQMNIELRSYNDLPKSALHREYQDRCKEKSLFSRYTSERFLYLWDLIENDSLENIFHLENDNMLYANLEPLLALFQKQYPGIGATFDNEERCIPGFMWIPDAKAMKSLAKYFVKKASKYLLDMQVIGLYRREFSNQLIDALPIIMPQYASCYPLISAQNHTTQRPEAYSNQFELFQAIFDAAAIGQFLGGVDPIHKNNQPGFINESCLFNPSLLQYDWICDEQGRRIPHATFLGRFYKIINLHIHSKRLHEFKSVP